MDQKPIEITLTLTLDELNTIIKTIAKLPLEQSYDLYNKIQQQAQPQVSPPMPAAVASQ